MDSLVALRSAVRAALEKYSAGDVILVAVSGGADSLALSEVAKIEGERLALKVIGVTIDHQLQSGSAAQAEKVVSQLSIPCLIEKVEVEITPTKKGTFEIHCGMNMFHGKVVVE